MRKYIFLLGFLSIGFHGCKEAQAHQVDDVEAVTVEEMKTNDYFEETRVVQLNSIQDIDDSVLAAQAVVCDKNLGENLSNANKPHTVAVFCKNEDKNPECSRILKEMGYEQVTLMEEGISQWKLKATDPKE